MLFELMSHLVVLDMFIVKLVDTSIALYVPKCSFIYVLEFLDVFCIVLCRDQGITVKQACCLWDPLFE